MWRRIRYVLLLLALSTLAVCPAAWRDFRRHRAADEAPALLRFLAGQVIAEAAARGGRLPQQPAGPTPPPGRCCEQDGVCEVEPARWDEPGWRALRFSVDDPHRYVYQYEPVDGGRAAVLRAIGDLDCDGEPGVVELRLDPDGEGGWVRRWTVQRPGE